jgi:hypothetical protein
MGTSTLTRLYDTHEDALSTVRGLEAAGMGHDEISLIGGNQSGQYAPAATDTVAVAATDHHESDAIGAGAAAGTIIGGGLGLMAGIGAMAIPGVGPVVAAGWLVATLAGAGVGAVVGGGAGGLVGVLTGAGVSEQDAHVYAEGIRRGGFLVTARVDDNRVGEAQRILSSRGVDVAQRRTAYEQEGWKGFQENAPSYQTTERADTRV